MSCLAILSRYKFVSGAEEKIVRIFESPLNFVENFHNLCRIPEDDSSDFIKGKNIQSYNYYSIYRPTFMQISNNK